MTTKHNKTLVQMSYWAVGRASAGSEVAIKLNDFPAILMNASTARDVAAALISEADAASQTKPRAVPQPFKDSTSAAKR